MHTADKPVSEDVDFDKVARRTAGLTGAELANICNEAAISAARQGRSALAQADFDYALERVVAGMETPRTLNERERTIVAYHEAGHALCAECSRARRRRTASRSSRAAWRSATRCTTPRRTATWTASRS